MRCVVKALIVVATLAIVSSPAVARAEGYVSPWVSANAGSNWSNFDNGRAGFGVNAGGMGAGVIGGELGFGWSPSFFGTKDDFGNNSVLDLMGNVIVGVPIGGTHGAGVRPFVTGGLGLIRTQIDGGSLTGTNVLSHNNMFGWDLGAGVMGYFNDHVGLRGDFKYLRGFEDQATGVVVIDANGPGQFHFWRAAIGVVFR
jgi:outer membrane protein with beta-barrel domain